MLIRRNSSQPALAGGEAAIVDRFPRFGDNHPAKRDKEVLVVSIFGDAVWRKPAARVETGKTAKGARARLKPDLRLPTTAGGWIVLAAVVLVAVYALLLLAGMHTGRIGFIPVEGDSMMNEFPWGCQVFVLPLSPREGDYVIARVAGIQEGEVEEDFAPGLVLKRLEGGKLVATDAPTTYEEFEALSIVVARFPVQKLLWWMDKGAQGPAPVTLPPYDPEGARTRAEEERAAIRKKFIHQLEGAIAFEAAPAALGDGDLETTVALAREEGVVLTPSAAGSEVIVYVTGDDELAVASEGQELARLGPFPGLGPHRAKVKFGRGSSLELRPVGRDPAPPGVTIHEVILR